MHSALPECTSVGARGCIIIMDTPSAFAAEEPVLNAGHGVSTQSEPTTWCSTCGGCGMVHYCRENIVIKNGKPVHMCQQV